MAQAEKLMTVGALKGPHGLKGMVKAKISLDDYNLLMTAGPLLTLDGRSLTVKKWQPVGQGLVALTLEGVTTIDAAEALKGTAVQLDRSRWPEDEDKVYLDSLIGVNVLAPDEETIVGTVKNHIELPAGPALEVEMDGKVKVLPLDAEFVELGDEVYLTELGVMILSI